MAFLYSPPSSASGSSTYTFNSQTTTYTVVAGDLGKIVQFTGTGAVTCTLTAAATLGSGFNCWIWSDKTTGALTVSPASGTINGAASINISRGGGYQIVSDGTNFIINGLREFNGISYDDNNSPSTRPASTGSGSLAIGYSANASAGYSTAIGTNSAAGGSIATTGLGAMALGGSYASGADSFAAASADNTTTYGAKTASAVAIGYHATSSSTRSIALGYLTSATGTGSVAIGGYAYGAQAAATYSIAIGDGSTVTSGATAGVAIGWNNSLSSTANGSIALGNENQTNPICGKITYGPTNTPGSGVPAGRPRWGNQVVFADTTDATPTVLTTAASSGSSTATHNTIIGIENNTALMFSAMIVARQSAASGTASAAWKVEGLLRREGTLASTALVNYITTIISNVPGWTIAVSADTLGGLSITATGAAATNIRWTATVQTSEVTYA
jgi:hypothetical protein